MFKKMRNRILLQNMVMVSAVVVAAFAVLFASTYNQIQSSNQEKLTAFAGVSMLTLSSFSLPGHTMLTSLAPEELIQGEEVATQYISVASTPLNPSAGLSFSVLADGAFEVVEVDSMVALQEPTYTQAVRAALSGQTKAATVNLEGRLWQYSILPVSILSGTGSGTPSNAAGPETLSHIRFVDVTDSYNMLRSLGFTLAGLMLVLLTLFFFISRYFANRAVRPMEEAWEKQNRFIADASHELKTPLMIINANCGALHAGAEESVQSQIKWVGSIERAADRISGQIGRAHV